MFENPRRGRQARNFTENDPKILDLKSSSEQIILHCRWVALHKQSNVLTGPAERLKRHSRNNIRNFYPFELKVCRMVELFIRNNSMIFVVRF